MCALSSQHSFIVCLLGVGSEAHCKVMSAHVFLGDESLPLSVFDPVRDSRWSCFSCFIVSSLSGVSSQESVLSCSQIPGSDMILDSAPCVGCSC